MSLSKGKKRAHKDKKWMSSCKVAYKMNSGIFSSITMMIRSRCQLNRVYGSQKFSSISFFLSFIHFSLFLKRFLYFSLSLFVSFQRKRPLNCDRQISSLNIHQKCSTFEMFLMEYIYEKRCSHFIEEKEKRRDEESKDEEAGVGDDVQIFPAIVNNAHFDDATFFFFVVKNAQFLNISR